MIKLILNSAVVLIAGISTAAYANSIDALERERANTINLILDKTISITERNNKLEKIKLKLLDMERMIINNKNINIPRKFLAFKKLFKSDNFNRFKCIFLPFDAVIKALKLWKK